MRTLKIGDDECLYNPVTMRWEWSFLMASMGGRFTMFMSRLPSEVGGNHE